MDKLMKKFSRMDDNKKRTIIIGIGILLCILVVVFAIVQHSSDNYNNIKQNRNNYLVYSKVEKTDETYPKYVPFINIKSDTVNQVNDNIDKFVANYVDSDKALVTYEYNINGIFLSVVVKIIDYKEDYAPEIYFRTYNINLNTRKPISNESMLDFFHIEESKVSQIIEGKFKSYYADLVKEGYYEPRECDYECFLEYRDVNNYLDNVNYYVKDGNLIAYKPFIFYSIFNDEEYFKEEHFEFLLVVTDKD